MEISEAVALIRGAGIPPGGTWADLGAGSGTFTLALARLLGERGTVHAVDRDAAALAGLANAARGDAAARVGTLVADLREPLPLSDLDGVLMANALHFVATGEQVRVLSQVLRCLRRGGGIVLVEYDQRTATPWVPHPVPLPRFVELARACGLGEPREVGRRRSRFGPKDIYAAVARVGG